MNPVLFVYVTHWLYSSMMFLLTTRVFYRSGRVWRLSEGRSMLRPRAESTWRDTSTSQRRWTDCARAR